MNFGVIIRSIGERTETLCLEACRRVLPKSKIHIVRDYYPTYRAYRQMYNISLEKEYDWYLGLDADVVLKDNWLDVAEKKINELAGEDYFGFSFSIRDKFLRNLDRGNHFYCGRFTKRALWFLENRTRDSLKPESYISRYLKSDNPPKKGRYFKDIVIGYHGYEQFYKHIYYRFLLRRFRIQRDPEGKEKYVNLFKNVKNLGDLDFYAGKLGWEYAESRYLMRLLNVLHIKKLPGFQILSEQIDKQLLRNGLIEKSSADLPDFDEFLGSLEGTAQRGIDARF